VIRLHSIARRIKVKSHKMRWRFLITLVWLLLATVQATTWTYGGGVAFPGVVNVANYGAACDGVTDDTNAINTAVAAAGSNANGAMSMATLFIPGQCLVKSTITIRNGPSGKVVPFVIKCSGGGAGLLWGGTDDTGPVLTLGDATNAHLDSGFLVENCFITGAASHTPSIAVLFANNQNAEFRNGTIATTHIGIKCSAQCLFAKIDRTFFQCLGNCVQMSVNNASQLSQNNFFLCGGWCYYGPQEASTLLINNYFEGNVSGASGSIYIHGDGDKLISNTFEDQQTAAGSGFLSVNVANANGVLFEGNYYVGGCGGGTGCPNYFILLGASGVGGNTAAEFHGEITGDGGNTGSGFVIDAESSLVSTWFGGMNCAGAKLFGGTTAASMVKVSACGGL
jgi:Pectate lyase superfamily protein